MSSIPESSALRFMKQFIHNFVSSFEHIYIKFPDGDKLKAVNDAYSLMGFPMCCGSMDATHIKLGKCPYTLKQLCTGKEGYPTLAFNCVVGPNRECYYCSQWFHGSNNDIVISKNCKMCDDMLEGKLAEVEGVMFDEKGEPHMCKGGYIIVDGGYPKSQYLIDGTTHSWDVRTTVWSEWLESVRKDIECFFGIMKSRFRIFANAIQLHNFF
jgi:hypothetical protein